MGSGISSSKKTEPHPYLAYIHHFKPRVNPYGSLGSVRVTGDRDGSGLSGRRRPESLLSQWVMDATEHPTQYRGRSEGYSTTGVTSPISLSCIALPHSSQRGMFGHRAESPRTKSRISSANMSRVTSAISTRTSLSDPGLLPDLDSQRFPWYLAKSSNQHRFTSGSKLSIAQPGSRPLELLPVEVTVRMKRDLAGPRPHSCPVPGTSKSASRWRSVLPPKPQTAGNVTVADNLPSIQQTGPISPRTSGENKSELADANNLFSLPNGEDLGLSGGIPSAAVYR